MGSRRSNVSRLKLEMNKKSCFAETVAMLLSAQMARINLEAILREEKNE